MTCVAFYRISMIMRVCTIYVCVCVEQCCMGQLALVCFLYSTWCTQIVIIITIIIYIYIDSVVKPLAGYCGSMIAPLTSQMC